LSILTRSPRSDSIAAPHGGSYAYVTGNLASGSGANDGRLTFWIDGSQQADLTGIDNDTRRVDYVTLGTVNGVPAGTSGTYYFDAFESRRSSYIGQQAGMRQYFLGKSMPKRGLAKRIAASPDVAGRYAPLYDEINLDAPTDFLFTGQRFEEELGLYLLGSR
jgi:hypothetical protein